MKLSQFAVSPCSNPELGLEEVLTAYSQIGYRTFEVFTSWTTSAFDYRTDPAVYMTAGQRHGMAFHSMHLPPLDGQRFEASLVDVECAIRFARGIGAQVVLYKATDRPTYIHGAVAVLDACESAGVTAVVQNHCGSALSSLADVEEVLEGVADPRLRSLLEVGHFHSAGVMWPEAVDYLGSTIALIHVKDQVGRQSVPFGAGEIDLGGLFRHMSEQAYEGYYVVEMEVADQENTLVYLARAREYVTRFCGEQ